MLRAAVPVSGIKKAGLKGLCLLETMPAGVKRQVQRGHLQITLKKQAFIFDCCESAKTWLQVQGKKTVGFDLSNAAAKKDVLRCRCKQQAFSEFQ